MSPKGTGTPAHIRALDKTLIGEGCWEYGHGSANARSSTVSRIAGVSRNSASMSTHPTLAA